MNSLVQSVTRLAADHAWSLPRPGLGQSPQRWHALCEIGRVDLSLARVMEAHADALSILAEAGHDRRAHALYGVWASDGASSRLNAQREAGQWVLEGRKQYCTGASFVSAALVTAHCADAVWLFDVPMTAPGIQVERSNWQNSAFADTATGPVTFERVIVPEASLLGGPGWYLERPGFWHGAVGPAACWAGGAMSLVDAACALNRGDPHSRAHLGALIGESWGLTAVLEHAGREIDADPQDKALQARRRALMARHLIERSCTEILDRFGRATGPQLLAFDAQVARQYSALALYIRQCHGERDLESIAP
jgi:alkylation response protein AidB-like acyl-CoA dehydrogenase